MDQDIRLKLDEYHKEELNDVAKYAALVELMISLGHHKLAGIVRDIEKDEQSHVHAIEHMMKCLDK